MLHISGFHCNIPELVYVILQSDHKLKAEILCTVLQNVVILCKVMKIMWFEEANFKLSSRINSHSYGDQDVADTHLSLTLPSNKRECLLGVLFPTFLFWSPFFLE
jgi:hypothetical protein